MTSGSEKRARKLGLTIRLTVCERLFIDAAAEAAGLTAGSYARRAILGAPAFREVRKPPVERQELARLLGELGRVGNNLNQLTRNANVGAPTDREALSQLRAELTLLAREILKALGRGQ